MQATTFLIFPAWLRWNNHRRKCCHFLLPTACRAAKHADVRWQLPFNGCTSLQGFWPDGLYTPPSAEAWAADIQTAKRLGYNTLRKHIKVEPEQCAPGPLLYPACMCR